MSTVRNTRTLKGEIESGKCLKVFVIGNLATPRFVDFVCGSGLVDVIWFDLEHFDISVSDLALLNIVAKRHSVFTIARIRANDYQIVMKTLETGVDGIMCAMVSSASEAEQIVRWAKFNNPEAGVEEAIGQRGWNGGNIDANYGRTPVLEYIRTQNNENVILCQIETSEALEQAREISQTKGVDALFFGPGDFSAGIGKPGQIGHPEVLKALEQVAEAAKQSGKWWGTVAPGPLFAQAKHLGGQFLCAGGDVKVMNLGLAELAKAFATESAESATSQEIKY